MALVEAAANALKGSRPPSTRAPSLPGVIRKALEKSVLLGPAPLRKAAAMRSVRPEEAWMLRQPRQVRRTYAAQVLDVKGDLDVLTEMWMLRQPENVRESYIEEVLQSELRAANAR